MSDLKPAADHIEQFFKYDHLPEKLQVISKPFGDLAQRMVETLPRNPERTVMLRKLLEAKDAAVRALVAVAVLLVLLPSVVFAQAVVTPVAQPGPLSSFFVSLLPHVLPLLMSFLLVIAFPAVLGWIKAQKAIKVAAGQSTALLSVGEKVAHLAELAVASVDSKMVPDIAARAEKGTLTADDGAALRADGLDLLKQLLSPEGLAQVAAALGTPKAPAAPAVVDAYLVAHNEVAVDVKNNAAAVVPAKA